MKSHAPTSAEREAFEAAMNATRQLPRKLSFTRTKSPSGRDEYANTHLESCWVGWQARAAMQTAEPVEQRYPGAEVAAFANIAAVLEQMKADIRVKRAARDRAPTAEPVAMTLAVRYGQLVAEPIGQQRYMEECKARAQAAPDRAPSIAPKPWQERMEAHYAKGSVQCLPTQHFMAEEIADWRKLAAPSIDSAADAKDAARWRYARQHSYIEIRCDSPRVDGWAATFIDLAVDQAIAALQPEDTQ